MKKLAAKKQNLQEALELIVMERYIFFIDTYHTMNGRISVEHTKRFIFEGTSEKRDVIGANIEFNNPITNNSEWIESFLLESTSIKRVKTLFRNILKLESKTQKEYLDNYTRMYATQD